MRKRNPWRTWCVTDIQSWSDPDHGTCQHVRARTIDEAIRKAHAQGTSYCLSAIRCELTGVNL